MTRPPARSGRSRPRCPEATPQRATSRAGVRRPCSMPGTVRPLATSADRLYLHRETDTIDMTDHARALAARSPIGALALVVLLTIGCDAVTPGAGSTVVTSSPAASASKTAAPSLADVVPVRPPTSPSPMRAAAPPASATPEPRREAFAMSLYRKGDYVAQYTLEWCVGASLQMTLNMATDQTRTSRASQQALWEMARRARTARSAEPTARLDGGAQRPRHRAVRPRLDPRPGRGSAGRGDRTPYHAAPRRPGHVAWPSRLGDERLRIAR